MSCSRAATEVLSCSHANSLDIADTFLQLQIAVHDRLPVSLHPADQPIVCARIALVGKPHGLHGSHWHTWQLDM